MYVVYNNLYNYYYVKRSATGGSGSARGVRCRAYARVVVHAAPQ